MSYYAYIRVSTSKQDIARQSRAMRDWAKQYNISRRELDFYVDYYSGKSFTRVSYQKMKSKLVSGDYVIIKEVDRLGRNWDGIKHEWQELKDKGVNIIIIDMPILSDPMPNEKSIVEGLDMRLIKEQILSLMCYSAQKERERISRRTKEALAIKRITGTKTGRPIGRPRNKASTDKNFINALRDVVYCGLSTRDVCDKYSYPRASFMVKIRQLKKEYQTNNYDEILKKYIEK